MASDDPRLEEIAAAVLDGADVDWSALASPSGDPRPALIQHLRTVAAVAGVHRSAAADAAPHPCWGPLRLLERIGSGSFGEVYRAWDTRLDREVALKLLSADTNNGAAFPSSVIQEGRLLARIRHPNVVTIYGAERLDGRVGLWMEFIHGRTLAQLVEGGRVFTAREVAAMGAELCDALAAVHDAGLLHRDIKAANVMVADDARVVLMDFGTVKDLADGSAGELAGTPLYLAPEVLAGADASARSDIYSVGVLLYYLMTHRYPVPADSLAALKTAHERRERSGERIMHADLPSRIARVLDRALDPQPDRRYDNAAALKSELVSISRRTRANAMALMTGIVITAAVPLAFVFGDRFTGADSRLTRGSRGASTSLVPPSIIGRQRLTQTGDAVSAALSPDGTLVVIDIENGGRSSLWLHRRTGSSEELAAPAPVRYSALTFAPDGRSLFYLRSNRDESDKILFRQTIASGAKAQRLYTAANLQGALSVAPDGQRAALVRNSRARDESLLVVLDVRDGSARALARRGYANAFWQVAWSPDGRTIAAGTGNADEGRRAMQVVAVNADDGSERMLSSDPWAFVGRMSWLGDGSGLLMVATRELPRSDQIWLVDAATGTARRITDDADGYRGISLDAKGTALVTGQVRARRAIWVASARTTGPAHLSVDAESAREISSGRRRLSWTPEGDIVFSSTASGTPNIWRAAADGTRLRQLTRVGDNSDPTTSLDGKTIVFRSNRGDGWHLWRMDADGTNAVQLTADSGEGDARITPDGRWVIYNTMVDRRLWRVPLAGGAPSRLTDTAARAAAVSPDGRWIAYNADNDPTQSGPWQITIVPFAGGVARAEFSRPRTELRTFEMHWTPDGKAITYEATIGGVSNLWSQPLSGAPAQRLTNFSSDYIYAFAWSRDGARLAVVRGAYETDILLYSLAR